MGVNKRLTHSREFEVEAVRKILVDDRSTKDVGAKMGVRPDLLARWGPGVRWGFSPWT